MKTIVKEQHSLWRVLKLGETLFIIGCFLGVSGCSLSSMDGYDAEAVEKFDYSNFKQVPLSLQMTDSSGDGLMGVQVTIRRAAALPFDDPAYIPGEVLYRGRTGRSGMVSMPASFPAGTDKIEVISQLKGYQGSFTEPKMLEDWGAFAPSSVVKTSLNELSNFKVSLAEKK